MLFSNLLKSSTLKLILALAIVLVVYLGLITALIRVEQDSPQSALTTYENAVWYTVVTLTTVGYGDLFPATMYGRFIGYIFILASLVFYGLLIGQFTNLVNRIRENRKLGYNGTNMEGHAVIIGWNDFGRLVLEQLMGVGKPVAIVTNNKVDVEFIQEQYRNKKIFVLYCDFMNFDMVRKANVESSSIVFVNLNNDTEKLVYILNMKKLFPDLDYVVTLDNGDLKNTFMSAGVTNTISKNEISSKLLASYMFEPDVAEFNESILSFAQNDTDYDIKQFLVTERNPYVGKQYQEAFHDLKTKYNSVLIGITKRDKFGHKKLLKNPLGDLKIAPGDYLLLILNGKANNLLTKVFGVHEGYYKEA